MYKLFSVFSLLYILHGEDLLMFYLLVKGKCQYFIKNLNYLEIK